MNNMINDFTREEICIYKGETYTVRDNGAVKRHSREFGKRRPLDDIWTFGKIDKQKGYLFISDVQVHRIVATAFHGKAPTDEHIVDHINTNKQDNRPENLRWLTRFENIVLNPISCKRIEYLTGKPIDYVLQHIEILHKLNLPQEYNWMRTVTREESQNCYMNLLNWAKQENIQPSKKRGTIGEWVYQKRFFPESKHIKSLKAIHKQKGLEYPFQENVNSLIAIHPSLTSNAMVKGEMISSYFPCCHQSISDTPLQTYRDSLKPGNIYYENHVYKTIVLESVLYNKKIIVKYESGDGKEAVKPWSVGTITFENGMYIHSLYKNCFKRESADKYFTILQDKEWTGGEVFDDFC